MKDINIRKATTRTEFDEVYKLTYRVYAQEGYCVLLPNEKLQHYPHLDEIPETTVLIISEKSLIIGTNSITLDGPNGLHVDKDFRQEMIIIRKQCSQNNKKLASSWRIVTDPLYRNQWTLIKLLIGETFKTCIDLNIGLLVCDFHPKHERFYNKIVGFTTIAHASCNSVGGKPAVLMTYNVNKKGMPKHWKK